MKKHDGQPKLVHVTTVPITLRFFQGQVSEMRARGFEVHAVSSPGPYLDEFGEAEGVHVHAVPMPRRIAPLEDLIAVAQLWRLLRRIRPDIVHAHTPKGALLGVVAGRLAGVPVCIRHIHGLPFVTSTGLKRWLVHGLTRLSCQLADEVLCVSPSVRDLSIAEGLCPTGKIHVLGSGSVNGLDAVARFNPARFSLQERRSLRDAYGIPPNATVIGFIGRIVKDKGVTELVAAWMKLRLEYPDLRLLVVGPFESEDPVPPEAEAALRDDPRIHMVGEEWDTPPLYSMMDVFCLPTYREGFGIVAIEAAAMEVPVVSTRIPGIVDAVLHGVNGQLVPAHDAPALADALRAYLSDPGLRRRHGRAGRKRVLREFQQEPLWEAQYTEYARLLKTKGLPSPRPEKRKSLPAPARGSISLMVQTTVPISLWAFFSGQLRWLQERGFTVHAVSSPGAMLDEVGLHDGVAAHAVPMRRAISPLADASALARLVRLYRREQPTIVHGFTPKGGLLAMASATLTRRPARVYTIFGLPHQGKTGFRRWLLRNTEKMSCALAHRVFVECPSIRQVVVDERICAPGKIRVSSAWCFNNVEKAAVNGAVALARRPALRRQFGIPENALVLGFVGRMVRDKGVNELVEAFDALAAEFPDVYLLFVGDYETEDPLSQAVKAHIAAHPRIRAAGFQPDVLPYLACADVLAHPSYREGLPTAPIEANAMGIPVVSTDIPGCVDAIERNETGFLVQPRDAAALADALRRYIVDPDLRRRHGQAGRDRVRRVFQREPAWEALAAEYRELAGMPAENRLNALPITAPLEQAVERTGMEMHV